MPKFITSQNIEIEQEQGSLGERIVAYIIDSFILVFTFLGISLLAFQSFQRSNWIIFLFIPFMFYSLLFEYFGNGQTLGKRAMNLRVVRLDGNSPSFVNYLLRWLFRIIDIQLFSGVIAIVSILVTRHGQRVGDLAAGTTVIKIRKASSISPFVTPLQEDHKVTFPQVKQLSDRQIELLRKALKMKKEGHSKEGVPALAQKLKEKLSIDSNMPDVKFLYTIIADYEYYANQEF